MSAPTPPPAAAPSGQRSSPVAAVVLCLIWVLGFGSGAVWIVYSQVSGDPATAVIQDCERRGKPASYVCTGTWTLDGTSGATVSTGIVEGVDEGDIGDEVEVRVKGERAYSLSLRLPIILGVVALSVPVLVLVSIVRSRRKPLGFSAIEGGVQGS